MSTAPAIKPEAAAHEVLLRRRGRESLLAFTEATHPSFLTNWHHKELCDALEKVERGEIDRLMIFAPPRHGKSEIVSIRFPSWYLGKHPDHQIICTSYGDDLASNFGRSVRNLIASGDYKRFFKTELAADSRAKDRWATDSGGYYLSCGIHGGATGHGAHVLVIDDPFKNREEADSQAIRDKVWNIYDSDLQSRLMPGGAIVLMHTRWHEDDLAGRLLEKMANNTGDKWVILKFPAIINEGIKGEKSLFPAWFSLADMKRRRKNVDKRTWHALYQQEPQPEQGEFFQKEWFKRYVYGRHPKYLSIYMASDFAVTTKEQGGKDFTEHGVFGIDHMDNIWVLDWWYGQTPSDVWIQRLIDLVQKWKPIEWYGETGQIRRSIEPLMNRMMMESNTYFSQNWLSTPTDKAAQSMPFRGRASQGKVLIPECSFGDRLLDHLLRFPTSRMDHSVDVCSKLGQALDKLITARVPQKTPHLYTDRWDKLFRKAVGNEQRAWRVM